MSKLKSSLKKIIFKVGGEKGYKKAYVKGKIQDIKNNKYDEIELSFSENFIKEDSIVLDLGANYGHYCVKMAQKCLKGKVIAFEPIPFTFDVLTQVVKGFGLTNIDLHHAAVSNAEGEITMQLPLLDFGGPNTGVAYIGNEKEENSDEHTVKTIKLDDLDIQGSIDFVKMDIEGHEPIAVEGMRELLTKHQPTILIEFSHTCMLRAGHTPAYFSDVLKNELGYEFYELKETLKGPLSLSLNVQKHPSDGYYFLIHQAQSSKFESLINS
mgnify:CR=1 FL=1